MIGWLIKRIRDARKNRQTQVARSRPRTRLSLEVLEDRLLLDANGIGSDVTRISNDISSVNRFLVDAVQTPQANTPPSAGTLNQWNQMVSELAADVSDAWRAFVQYEFAFLQAYQQAIVQAFATLLADMDGNLTGQSFPPSPPAAGARPVPSTPPAATPPPSTTGTSPGGSRPVHPDLGFPGGNLLTNGGFETGNFTGWTQGRNTGNTGVSPWIGNDSTYAAYLGPVGSDGTLSQTIATTPGTDYRVNFDLKSDGKTPNDFTATFAGQTLQMGKDVTAFPYTTYTYEVQATSTSSTLQFTFRDDPGYFDLDNAYVGTSNALGIGGPTSIPFIEAAAPTNVQVATFTDSDGNIGPKHYSVNINWGNGQSTPGTVQYSNGQFQILGTMSYSEEGSYPINVTIHDDDGTSATFQTTANVTDAALDTDSTSNITATAGLQYNGQFVNFSDSNTNAPVGDFAAQINWGDQQTSPGTVVSLGNGNFMAGGSHTYANPGTYPINVTITDDGGSQTSASATANVSANLQPPVANNDSYTLSHGTIFSVDAAYGVLANDTDPNHLPLSAVLVSGPSDGTLTLNSDGSFTYTPNAHWTGSDSFQYYATDGQQKSNTATVSLTVQDTGTITTQPDSYSTPHDQALSIDATTGVLANDSDSDGEGLTANLATAPSNGTLQLNSDGSFTYTPNAGYAGNDSFQYTASDGAKTSTPTTVSLTVTNTAPTAINHTYGIPENTTVNVTSTDGLLQGASDTDGDYLALTSWTQPSDGTLQVNPDGSFSYAPTTNYTGSDSFQYTISDGAATATATVTLNVHATDTAPAANSDSYSVERNNEFSADDSTGVLANDTDADGDPLTATLVSGPTNGSLTLNSDGSFDYTPNTNFTGTDSFTYKASDGVLTSQPATVTLTVSGSASVAADQTFSATEATSLNAPAGALLLGVYNPDNMTLTAQDVTQPSNGTVTVNANSSFVYTPNSGFTGSDAFTYDLTDGTLTSSPATLTVIVKASNTLPTASALSYTVDENNILTLDSDSGALSGASDSDGDRLLAELVSGPSNGTLALNLDGSFTYTPNAGFFGNDSFQYEVFDGTGYSNAATVTLTVTSNVPTANNDTYGVHPGAALNVSATTGVLANDSDADGLALSATLVSGTSDGSLTLNGDGSFTYTPNVGFTGTDTFTYEATNGVATSSAATVTLNVHAANSQPMANDDSYSASANSPLTLVASGGVLGIDTDPDNDTLSASLVSSPSHGSVTLNSDGSFTYIPNNNYIGTDSFTYQAYDGLAYSKTATVTISNSDDPPSTGDDSYSIAHGQTLTVPASSGVLSNDSDPAGDTLTAQLVSGPSHGELQFHSDGSFTYTPDTNFAGTDSFTYEAGDGMMNSSPTTVILNVTDAAPLAVNFYYAVRTDEELLVENWITGDYDPDGDTLTAQLVTGPSHGTLQEFYGDHGGTFTYIPDSNYIGKDSFTYQVTDGMLASNIGTMTFTVGTSNPNVPVASDNEFADGMNQPLTVSALGVLQNDTGLDGTNVTAVLGTGPADGTLTLNSDGSFTYTPNTGFTGDDSFTYYASVNGNFSPNPGTVTIHVSNVSLTMTNGPWVPINANDDNKSPITNMIPAERDYNYLKQLGANDPQLQPLQIKVNNPNPFGFIKLSIQPAAGATGEIRLWSDQRKTKQIMPGVYLTVGPNALPATIYVEGINPTSRTIVGGVIQPAPTPDNTITAAY